MIVPAMTHEEVYREIDLDKHELCKWEWIKSRTIAERIRKSIRFPKIEWYEFNSSRHNRYFMSVVIYGRNFWKDVLFGYFAIRKMEHGYAIYTFVTKKCTQDISKTIVTKNCAQDISKTIYLPHVFDRYAERCEINKSGLELIKHYIINNEIAITNGRTDDNICGRSVRYNGKKNTMLSVREGILLGEVINDIFVCYTFITHEMASVLQKDVSEKCNSKNIYGSKLLFT